MKKGLFHFVIFMMLLYFFNRYVNYQGFRWALPDDLFLRNYKELTRAEVQTWLFMLKWVIPGIVVILFMRATKFAQRVNLNWGITVVSVVVFIKLFLMVLKPSIYYFASQIQGGGPAMLVSNYFYILQSYMRFPMGLLLIAGTIKIFLTLEPVEKTHNKQINQDRKL